MSGEDRRTKPLLLLDLDGVLNPYGLLPGGPEPWVSGTGMRFHEFRMMLPGMQEREPQPVFLSLDHRPLLAELRAHFQIVWCTAWERHANDLVGPVVGLPPLEAITWPDGARTWAKENDFLGCWKTAHVWEWLQSHGTRRRSYGTVRQSWVWVDDELGAEDRRFFAERHDELGVDAEGPYRYRLHTVPSERGLGPADVATLVDWARSLGSAAGGALVEPD